MKLHLSTASGRNLITAYGAGYVSVNGERHTHGLVVLPDRIETTWHTEPDGGLSRTGAEFLASLGMEIVLVGTGTTQRFPNAATLRPLIEAGIGYEIMDTTAACRTYNILVAEDRLVAAALALQQLPWPVSSD